MVSRCQKHNNTSQWWLGITGLSLWHYFMGSHCRSFLVYVCLEKMGFLGGSDGKESACHAGDWGLIPGQEALLEKEMATHSSIVAWKIPWTEEPGRLQSTGSQRVRHDWNNLAHTDAPWWGFWKHRVSMTTLWKAVGVEVTWILKEFAHFKWPFTNLEPLT